MNYFLTKSILIFGLFAMCNSHGMMINPVGRASRWRYNETAPKNFNDNELFCGGFAVQWATNNGKCGLCGDNYSDTKPRAHEFGGEFGEGTIIKRYKSGATIPVAVNITANHLGDFTWHACNLDTQNESEECFNKIQLNLTNGSDKFIITSPESKIFYADLQIPNNLVCEHCVLRWTYRTGNNWGYCDDGTGRIGCGPQEHFRSCADISIKP